MFCSLFSYKDLSKGLPIWGGISLHFFCGGEGGQFKDVLFRTLSPKWGMLFPEPPKHFSETMAWAPPRERSRRPGAVDA